MTTKQIRAVLNPLGIFNDAQDVDGEANATLIAAAPDMLEALRAASEWLNDMGCEHNETEPDRRCTVCIVNQAIAKAEGHAQ